MNWGISKNLKALIDLRDKGPSDRAGTEPQSGSAGFKDRIRNSFKCTKHTIIDSNTALTRRKGHI